MVPINESDARRRLQAVVDHIESHLSEPLDVAALAGVALYSKSRFQQVWRDLTGTSILQYVRERRLTEAKVDLLSRTSSVDAVATKYCYDSTKSFSRAFRSYHGVTPANYKQTRSPVRVRPPFQFAISRQWARPPRLSSEAEDRFRRRTWRIDIELSMPDLRPEVVQYALFTADPLLRYKSELASPRAAQARTRLAEEYENPDLAHSHVLAIQRTATWDRLFAEVRGDQVYLLPGKSISDARLGFSSDRIDCNHWIATKVVGGPQAPMCWCIQLRTKPGIEISVVLDKSNVLDLVSIAGAYSEQKPADS